MKKNVDKFQIRKKANILGEKKLNISILLILILVLVLLLTIIFFFIFKQTIYTIKFDTTGGSIVDEIKTKKDGKLVLPEKEPEKDGYTFNGWEYDNKYIFSGTKLHDDIELKADWIEDNYEYVQVILVPGSGFDSIVVYVEKNQRILEPNNPEKKNNSFKGWYLDNNEFDFNTRINSNLVLIGKWDNSSLIYSDNEEYYCFDDSFDLKDGKCSKEIIGKTYKEYYCDENWELTKDNQCSMLDTSAESVDATPIYTCEGEYLLNGDKCTKSDTTNPSKEYYCTQGGLEGSGCYDYGIKTLMGVNVCGYSDQNYVNQQKEKVTIYCINNGGTLQTGCMYSCTKKVRNYLGDANVSYKCPNGYKLNNGKCTGTKTINATLKEYVCEDGYINSGSKCYDKKTAIKTNNSKSKNVCKEGFELKDNICVMTYNIDAIKK